MLDVADALEKLRAHDPARNLPPLSDAERDALRDRIMAVTPTDMTAGRLQRQLRAWSLRGLRRRGAGFRGLWRRGLLVPLVLAATAAVAAAATGVLPLPSMLQFADQNTNDPALTLFQKSVPYQGGRVVRSKDGRLTVIPFKETVIPSSVRMIAAPTVPGIGAVQFWVGDTEQGGYCTALRLPDGSWAELEGLEQGLGGAISGCRPTRRQVGWGSLIISGFDYTDTLARADSGRDLVLTYGRIAAPGDPVEVRDLIGGMTAPVIDGSYFLLVTDAARTKDGGYQIGDTHLVALDAAGTVVADETKPLPGTPG